MSESSNLQKISEAAYAKIVDKTNVQVVALTYIEEEADKRIEASLTNLLEKLAAMCQSCLAEAGTLKSLTGEELTKTYEMLEDDLEATSLRINADYELKLRLTEESVDRLRQDYQGVLDQFTEAQTELAELMQDGTASVALTALSRFRLLGSGGEDMSDKIDGILSNLLDVEKDLSMKTAALTLEMLSTWKRDFAKSLAEVRKTVSDNRALALSSEERFRQLAGGYSRKALEEIDAKVEELEKELRANFNETMEVTTTEMQECARQTAVELEQVVSYVTEKREKSDVRLQAIVDQERASLRQVIDTRALEQQSKLDSILNATTQDCKRMETSLAETEQRAAKLRSEMAAELLAQFASTTSEFESQIQLISERGTKQMVVLMEESENALKHLSSNVMERFRKSNMAYVELLSCSEDDVVEKLEEAKEECLQLIESFRQSLGTEKEGTAK